MKTFKFDIYNLKKLTTQTIRNNIILTHKEAGYDDYPAIDGLGFIQFHETNKCWYVYWTGRSDGLILTKISDSVRIWNRLGIGIAGYGPSDASIEQRRTHLTKYQKLYKIQ